MNNEGKGRRSVDATVTPAVMGPARVPADADGPWQTALVSGQAATGADTWEGLRKLLFRAVGHATTVAPMATPLRWHQ